MLGLDSEKASMFKCINFAICQGACIMIKLCANFQFCIFWGKGHKSTIYLLSTLRASSHSGSSGWKDGIEQLFLIQLTALHRLAKSLNPGFFFPHINIFLGFYLCFPMHLFSLIWHVFKNYSQLDITLYFYNICFTYI